MSESRDRVSAEWDTQIEMSCEHPNVTLALRALIAFAGLESLHQSDFGAISQRDLLVTATHAEYWLRRLLDDVKDARQ